MLALISSKPKLYNSYIFVFLIIYFSITLFNKYIRLYNNLIENKNNYFADKISSQRCNEYFNNFKNSFNNQNFIYEIGKHKKNAIIYTKKVYSYGYLENNNIKNPYESEISKDVMITSYEDKYGNLHLKRYFIGKYNYTIQSIMVVSKSRLNITIIRI